MPHIMKRLILPLLILSFSFASAQEISSQQVDVNNDTEVTITSEVVINDNETTEVAYTSKALRDPDNIDFDNIYLERQFELFDSEKEFKVC